MSGTSLDGIDAALLRTDGDRVIEAGQSHFRAFSDTERALLTETMAAAVSWGFAGPPPNILARAEAMLDAAHIEAVRGLLDAANISKHDVDYIGYHGQTVLHRAPQAGTLGQTLQIGDGSRIARELHIPTVYDFRSHDVSMGGQGAPLAPIYHRALVRDAGLSGVVGVLNIGGVSNITIINGDDLLATDCGPGNGPLDSWVAQHGLGAYDKDGALSLAGTPDFARLESWLRAPFFYAPVPKSADRYDFDVLPRMHGLAVEDGAATLACYAAHGVANTVKQYGQAIDSLILCGGGRHNPAMRYGLAELLDCAIISSDTLGWDGDALEAQAFAYMAARHIMGLPLSFPSTTGVNSPLCGGKLANP